MAVISILSLMTFSFSISPQKWEIQTNEHRKNCLINPNVTMAITEKIRKWIFVLNLW